NGWVESARDQGDTSDPLQPADAAADRTGHLRRRWRSGNASGVRAIQTVRHSTHAELYSHQSAARGIPDHHLGAEGSDKPAAARYTVRAEDSPRLQTPDSPIVAGRTADAPSAGIAGFASLGRSLPVLCFTQANCISSLRS